MALTELSPRSSQTQSSTWCKICGIRQAEDALVCTEAGADAVGLNFYAASPRALSITEAEAVATAVSISRVGLFVDPDTRLVDQAISRCSLDLLQFHGEEDPEFCEAFALPYIKAVRVRPGVDIRSVQDRYANAWALLLDSHVDGLRGGTGVQFDWDSWPCDLEIPLILAGGLTPDNVADAINSLRPAGVDVSGGVEGSVRGEKDPNLIRKFLTEVRRVER